jgi:hypothetical protein
MFHPRVPICGRAVFAAVSKCYQLQRKKRGGVSVTQELYVADEATRLQSVRTDAVRLFEQQQFRGNPENTNE